MRIRKLVAHHSIQVDQKFTAGDSPEAKAARELSNRLFSASGRDMLIEFEAQTNQLGVVISVGEVDVLIPWTSVKFLIREKEPAKK